MKKDSIKKPWGKEELLENNSKYAVKRLTMLKGHRCSLQFHEKKRETIYVLSGLLCLHYGETVHQMESLRLAPGDSFTIPEKLIHRMEGIADSVYLEASSPELDDVIRLSDDYDRELEVLK